MKKFITILAISTLIVNLIYISPVKATSDFDNTYNLTDSLRLKGDYYNVDFDASIRWPELFTKDDPVEDGVYPGQFRFGYNLASQAEIDEMRASWLLKENWTVSQIWTNSSKTSGDIVVTWSEQKNQSLVWTTANSNYEYPSNVRVENNDYVVTISENVGNSSTDRYFEVIIEKNKYSQVISNGREYPFSLVDNYFAYVENKNLPEGYSGSAIRESIDSEKEIISPEFDYVVNDKKITLKHRKDLDKINIDAWAEYQQDGYQLTNNDYQISWTITRKVNDEIELVHNSQVFSGQEITIDLPDYGEFDINSAYVAESCFDYESEITPPYCFIAYPSDTDEIDYQSKDLKLLVDGYYKEGSTTELNCLFGYCETPETNCNLENSTFEKTLCNVNKNINFGVINPSITAIRKLFISFIVPPSPSCNLNIPDVVLAGKTISTSSVVPSACSSAETLRDEFSFVSVLVNGVFAIMTIQIIVAMINRLTNHENNNLIEGV